MKTLAFFISASLVPFSSLINMVIAQGFLNTCSDISLSGSVLEYTCTAKNGQPNSFSTDLDLCITNNNGILQQSAKLVYPNTTLDAAVVRYIYSKISLYIVANSRQLAMTAE
jgi:hypothetical protein